MFFFLCFLKYNKNIVTTAITKIAAAAIGIVKLVGAAFLVYVVKIKKPLKTPNRIELSSWIIRPLFFCATLFVIVFKKKILRSSP